MNPWYKKYVGKTTFFFAIFLHIILPFTRVKYYNIFYNTKQIEGHRQDPVKREQMKIDNQKQLEQVLRERDERLKARANKVSSWNPCFLDFIDYAMTTNKVYLCLLSTL